MRCLIGLGSNLGARRHTLRQALTLIHETADAELLSVSFFYETEPWGVVDQPPYINAVALLETSLEPTKLLDRLQSIEAALGRVRTEHWGARTLDLDILSIEGVTLSTERLTAPHPLMNERAFVQVPLRDVIESTEAPRGSGGIIRTHGSPLDFRLRLIACVDRRWGLGLDGRLLFGIEEDMSRFRSMTLGSTVVMGRRTFESIGAPLDGRRNIVITHRPIDGVETVGGIDELFDRLSTDENIFVIGGGEIYRQLLPYVVEAHVTMVDRIVDADVRLIDLDARDDFALIETTPRGAFEYRTYGRQRCRFSKTIGRSSSTPNCRSPIINSCGNF